jgi:hypothetical protein
MRQQGFSYVIVMFLVALLTVVSVRGIESTLVAERQAKELELLWRGAAYRDAIKAYYINSPGSGKAYPRELRDLLYDNRLVRPTRPLRKLYRDPMAADGEWDLVRNEAGDLIGVRSRSPIKPLKRAGFAPEFANFTNAQRYSDWEFVYQQP